MTDATKTKIKWIVGLALAILSAIATYIGVSCTSIKNLELRGGSSVDGKTGVIVSYDSTSMRQLVRSAKE